MADAYLERRKRTLTDEDLEAISCMMHASQCASFTPEEISNIKAVIKPMKDLADVLKETRSVVIKAVVGAVLGGMLIIVLLGLKVWVKQP